MESIKKQSLPSNPTANAAPAPSSELRLRPPAIPAMSAPGRHLCGAVSHVGTLQAIRRVTTASPHLQHIFQLQPGTAGGPLSLSLLLFLFLSLFHFLSFSLNPNRLHSPLCLGPFVLGPAISAPSPGSTPESMITSSCITNFLSNIFRRLPPWVKFICCHCSARQLKDLYTHKTHTHAHNTKQTISARVAMPR